MPEIAQQAQNPLSLSLAGDRTTQRVYPERDPFREAPTARVQPWQSKVGESPPSSPEKTSLPDEPSLKVTAILVEGDRRIALVNGYPKRVGTKIGSWQIAAIEPDHLILKTPEGDKKIEIERQIADAKTPSHQ
jgi:hypothetical protein